MSGLTKCSVPCGTRVKLETQKRPVRAAQGAVLAISYKENRAKLRFAPSTYPDLEQQLHNRHYGYDWLTMLGNAIEPEAGMLSKS